MRLFWGGSPPAAPRPQRPPIGLQRPRLPVPHLSNCPRFGGVFCRRRHRVLRISTYGASSLIAAENEPVDVAQIAVALGVIHAVADDEILGNIETDIADRQIQRARPRFA